MEIGEAPRSRQLRTPVDSCGRESRAAPVALDVVAKLVLDVPGQGADVVLACVGQECLEVLADDAVQDRVFGPPGSIRSAARCSLRLQTANVGEHDESRVARAVPRAETTMSAT
jgi:hypothetical protein